MTIFPIVRELYANAYEHKDFRVFVREKMVSFDLITINRYYQLLNINNDEYHSLIEGELD